MKPYSWVVSSIQSHLRTWGLVLGLLTLLGFWQAAQLRLDGDLGRLLPDDAPSVQGLRALESVYGDQIGRLTVVLRGKEATDLRKVADELSQDLTKVPGVQRVVHQKPQSQLEDYRLLYMDLTDLTEVQERLNRRIRWEKQRSNPLFVELRESDPPSVDMDDISAKYELGDAYYETASGEFLVFVHANFPAGDLDRSRELVESVSEVVGSKDVTFALTGRYQKRIDQQDLLTQDIANATPAALVLILLFLLMYFRSALSVALVLVPLILGTALGMATAGLVFGSLNILTGFLAAVLMGLGVDYGIHLVSRYLDARSLGKEPRLAWEETFETSGRASIFSGLTTILALGSLSTSSFRAFYEFGMVASLGIALILASYALVLPWLIFALDRKNPKPALATRLGGALGAAVQRHANNAGLKWAFRAVYALVALLIIAGASGVGFDRTFDSLSVTDSESWKLDELVNRTLESSQTPAVLPVESSSHLDTVLQELESRRSQKEGYTLGAVLSTRDLLPTEQTEKREILEDLQDRLEDIPERARSEELVEFLTEIRSVLDAGELQLDGLPDALRVPFSRKDSPEASVVLIMPAIDLNDAKASRDFSTILRGLPGPDAEIVDAISDTLLLTEILEFVERDTAWMLEITLVGLILVALVAFRFTWDALRVVVFLLLTLGGALGLMGLLELEFNFINVLILPIWLGLGVDASFHLLIHLRDHPDEPNLHGATIVSIAAAFITSMIGFGALMMSHHVGLGSLGSVAVLGFVVMILLNLVLGLDMATRAARRNRP